MKYWDMRRLKFKFSMNYIFSNNKLIFLFSLMISFVIWLIININSRDTLPITISDIPVSIQLSESAVKDGLKIFSGQNLKAQVDICGNKLILSQVKKDDIFITAPQAASTITSPGTYTLELTAKKAGVLTDYEFASGVQPNFITIMVDRYREAEFTVEPEIEFSANPSYFLGSTILSSPSVVLSGPESEISKIKRIVVKKRIPQELESTFTAKMPIIMYDAYGEQIISETISSTASEIEVTIPVLTKKTLPIHPNFINAPEGFDLSDGSVGTSPNSLEIAGPQEQVEKMNSIELDAIDFHKIDLQNNRFDLPINLPQGCKSLNNIYSAEVFIDTSKCKDKYLRITEFSFINMPEGKTAKVYTDGIDVKFVGHANKIKSLSPSHVQAQINLSGKESMLGSMEVPAKIVINSVTGTWVYGEYLINIEVI